MTGYGKSIMQAGSKTITIDIRSLNSKQLDLNLRIQSAYRDKENLIRAEIVRSLERGKVDMSIQVKDQDSQFQTEVHSDKIRQRYADLCRLASELGANQENLFELAVTLPDTGQQASDEITEEEWNQTLAGIREAIAALNLFRMNEGSGLKSDLLVRVNKIKELMNSLELFEEERIALIRNRLLARFEELAPALQVSGNRFEEELIFYLEKLDVSEEKQRLGSHCTYFSECMNEPENAGRKLAFISQEMGREINTIGSKANHAEMQKLVVLMKDELEKIKEQLNNVL
jgi:uncharacterized protein (TIGR00255 family)